MNRMRNSTLENLVNKYSKFSPSQNSLVFSKISKVTNTRNPLANSIIDNCNESPSRVHRYNGMQNETEQTLYKAKNNCEQYLLAMREKLIEQKISIEEYQTSFSQKVLQKFTREYENLKNTILGLFDEIYRQNYEILKVQFSHKKYDESQELQKVKIKIAQLEADLQKSINGLRGAEYRKSIAEVALKDYDKQFKQIQILRQKNEDTLIQKTGILTVTAQKKNQMKQYLKKLWRRKKLNETKFPIQKQIPIYFEKEEEKQGICNIFS